MFFHQREGDVRPGMETHDLTEKDFRKEEDGTDVLIDIAIRHKGNQTILMSVKIC